MEPLVWLAIPLVVTAVVAVVLQVRRSRAAAARGSDAARRAQLRRIARALRPRDQPGARGGAGRP